MLSCIALAAIMQTSAGPIDAFRANLASVRAGVDFDCKIWHNLNPSSRNMMDFKPDVGPAGEPSYLIKGRWEYDGSSERYVVRVTGGSLFKPNAASGPLPSIEALCDDETFAYHYLKPGESSFRIHQLTEKFPIPVVGPFTFFCSQRFDRIFKVGYAGISPVRSKGERGGHPTEVEVYERAVGDVKLRDEVAYDPSVGYLPRYYRGLGYGKEGGRSTASVAELYLVDAKPCRAGGFVPTEWYLIPYDLDDFESKYPDYDENTKLIAPNQSRIIHFKVNQFEDKKDSARLAELAGVRQILAPGGPVFSKSKDGFSPMTMSQIKAAMGTRAVKLNRPALPNIDQAELHEFDRPKAANRMPYWVAGLALAAVAAFLIYRRARMLILLIGFLPMAGCGQRPIPRLSAAFTQTRILYDPTSPSLNLDLVISNVGNQTLKIMKADAGCS